MDNFCRKDGAIAHRLGAALKDQRRLYRTPFKSLSVTFSGERDVPKRDSKISIASGSIPSALTVLKKGCLRV